MMKLSTENKSVLALGIATSMPRKNGRNTMILTDLFPELGQRKGGSVRFGRGEVSEVERVRRKEDAFHEADSKMCLSDLMFSLRRIEAAGRAQRPTRSFFVLYFTSNSFLTLLNLTLPVSSVTVNLAK